MSFNPNVTPVGAMPVYGPQYLRKFKVKVQTYSGNIIEIVDLKVTFRTEKQFIGMYQWAEILIYNLSPATESDIFKNGQYLYLEAGYQNGVYGIIFEGFINQPIRGKDDGATYFLKLICIDGQWLLDSELVNMTIANGVDGQEIANQIARASSIPFAITIDPGVQQQKTTRGKVVFGELSEYLRSIAVNSNAVFYSHNGNAHITTLKQPIPDYIPELNSQSGLIGMPQQTDEGITFRTLINPNLDLNSWVKLNNRDIIQNQVDFGVPQTLLDRDGIYRIIKISSVGDTRENEWYYDIVAINQISNLPGMLNDPDQEGL